MFSTEREELRQLFFSTWKKYQEQKILEPIETQIIDIVLQHPEYHSILNDPEKYKRKDFNNGNPFLHIGLHLALREQINTNRPDGIHSIFQNLLKKHDPLTTEHLMMDCLEKKLWEAQTNNKMPDETEYLEALKVLLI